MKLEELNEISPSIILNLRENANNWYEHSMEGYVECKNFPISYKEGNVTKDLKGLVNLCKEIVQDYLKNDKRILILCSDGRTICGYIATFLVWWHEGATANINSKIKKMRNNEQKKQIRELMSHAQGIEKKNNFFNTKK